MPSSPLPLFIVDAFADRPFAGNAAAVCLLDAPADPGWMAAVAGELQQAATAFVYEQGEGFGLRWFVPGRELQLCGHGTLAAAHVLWETGQLWPDAPAQFQTVSGPLSARRDADAIALDFPAEPVQPLDAPAGLLEALGVEARALARGTLDLLVEVESEATVRAIRPDFSRLRQIDARGIIVTAAANSQQPRSEPTDGAPANGRSAPGSPAHGQPPDFVSRFFAPHVGLDEDAVTGSAHCLLGPYWQGRLGRDALTGYQASARGGTVRVQVNGPRVTLCGRAITVMSGSLVPPPPPA